MPGARFCSGCEANDEKLHEPHLSPDSWLGVLSCHSPRSDHGALPAGGAGLGARRAHPQETQLGVGGLWVCGHS